MAAMGGAHAGEGGGLGLDHGLEIVPSPGPLLLQIAADGGRVFIVQGFLQQATIGCGAGFGRAGGAV